MKKKHVKKYKKYKINDMKKNIGVEKSILHII